MAALRLLAAAVVLVVAVAVCGAAAQVAPTTGTEYNNVTAQVVPSLTLAGYAAVDYGVVDLRVAAAGYLHVTTRDASNSSAVLAVISLDAAATVANWSAAAMTLETIYQTDSAGNVLPSSPLGRLAPPVVDLNVTRDYVYLVDRTLRVMTRVSRATTWQQKGPSISLIPGSGPSGGQPVPGSALITRGVMSPLADRMLWLGFEPTNLLNYVLYSPPLWQWDSLTSVTLPAYVNQWTSVQVIDPSKGTQNNATTGLVVDMVGESTGTFMWMVTNECPARFMRWNVTARRAELTLVMPPDFCEARGIVLDVAVTATPPRAFAYVYTQATPGQLAEISLLDMRVTRRLNFSTSGVPAYSAALSRYGHLFLASLSSPSLLWNVDLPSFSLVETLLSAGGTDQLAWLALQDTDAVQPLLYGGLGFYPTGAVPLVAKYAAASACPTANGSLAECSGNGACVYARCQCTDPNQFHGDACDLAVCPGQNGTTGPGCGCQQLDNGTVVCNGVCGNGTCNCGPNWLGEDCTTRTCPNQCTSPRNGVCSGAPQWTCKCKSNYRGADCAQLRAVLDCDEYATCKGCFKNSSCGWCASHKGGSCLRGGIVGPDSGGCYSWHKTTCPVWVFTAVGWLVSLLAVVLVLIDVSSLLWLDLRGYKKGQGTVYHAKVFWRAERSNKTWLFLEQMQFIALTGLVATNAPTPYLTFTQTFDWTLLSFTGLPWSRRSPTGHASSTRHLLSMPQHISIMEAYRNEAFLATAFWFLVCMVPVALVLLALLVSSLVTGFVSHRRGGGNAGVKAGSGGGGGGGSLLERYTRFARNRPLYCVSRIGIFVYTPFVLFTAHWLTIGPSSQAGNIVGFVFMLLWLLAFIVALPLAIAGYLLGYAYGWGRMQKRLWRPAMLQTWGAFYNSFKMRREWFMVFHWAQRFVPGLLIGFLWPRGDISPLPCLLLLTLWYVVAAIPMCIVRPYLDVMRMVVEIIVTVFRVVVLLFMLVFLDWNHNQNSRLAFAVIIIALQLASFLPILYGFINSWFRYARIFSIMQMLRRCVGRDRAGLIKNADATDADGEAPAWSGPGQTPAAAPAE